MSDRTRSLRPGLLASVAAGLLAAVGAAALYGRGGPSNGPQAECRQSQALAERLRPLARGEMAGVVVPKALRTLPVLAFRGPTGEGMTLADLRDRTVLLNLWATWCVPCRTEMPALDRLEAALGSADFAVVAINMDSRDPEKPREWLKANKVKRLTYYADPDGKVFQTLRSVGRATGLPTSLVVDRSGCMVAHLEGPAEWASEDALALLRAAIGP